LILNPSVQLLQLPHLLLVNVSLLELMLKLMLMLSLISMLLLLHLNLPHQLLLQLNYTSQSVRLLLLQTLWVLKLDLCSNQSIHGTLLMLTPLFGLINSVQASHSVLMLFVKLLVQKLQVLSLIRFLNVKSQVVLTLKSLWVLLQLQTSGFKFFLLTNSVTLLLLMLLKVILPISLTLYSLLKLLIPITQTLCQLVLMYQLLTPLLPSTKL
jgi:hypothetical protein